MPNPIAHLACPHFGKAVTFHWWGHTKPWSRLSDFQSRRWWMELRNLTKPFAAVWAGSVSPHPAAAAALAGASAQPLHAAAVLLFLGGVCAVISVLFLQQPSWRHKIISKIIKHCSQYSSCSKTSSRGGVQMGDSSVRKLTAEADSRRIIGIQQTLKGQ